ncbi:hypothetical protein HDU67_008922 [Dinochytrium kinnereticum]|nr:hypothetical protein HDU67_008922 [Dinochytrium kinnereticum]
MKNIDPTRLSASSADRLYRFQYVSDFIGFGKDDIAALHASAPVVGPLVPTIVDAVYSKLFEFDVTRTFFTHRNEGFHGRVAGSETDITVVDEQIKFRKNMLSRYLVKLVTAEYDEKFVDYVDWVGRIHTTVQLEDKKAMRKKSGIHVDYVHVNALFGFVSSFVVEAVLGAGLPKDVETATVLAFNKLLWIQNDFFAKYYTEDSTRGLKQSREVMATVLDAKTIPFTLAAFGVGALVAGLVVARLK